MQRITLLLIFLFYTMHVLAASFTDKQSAIIYNEAIKTLKNYESLCNQLADDVVDIDEANKTSQLLIDLFVSRKAMVFNDLDPSQMLSKAYELETYVNNLQLWYPDGMKISIDFENLKAGNIIDHGNDIFTVDLMATKKNNGNYLNRQKNEMQEDLLYRIAFFQKTNTFESFKIAGIRSSKANTQSNSDHLLADVKSVRFTDKEMVQIKEQSKALLNDYINFISLLADPNELKDDKHYYSLSFLDLFKDSSVRVSNDIEPNPQDRWLTINDYQKNVVLSYPDGINNLGLNTDSIEYSKVIAEGTNTYYINNYIDKFFSGKYQDKSIFRDNNTYDFKISFERDENTFRNFKIASIDKFGVNLYKESNADNEQTLPSITVTSLKRTGIYYGLSFGAGKTIYKDPNLTADPVLLWDLKNKAAFSIEANATWYASNQWGVNVGLGYSHYSAITSLNGNYQNPESFTVASNNNLAYNKILNGSIDSLLQFNYVSIPISIIYHSNKKTDTWGLFAQLGLISSFNVGSSYQSTGNMETSGFFPSFPEGNQVVSSIAKYGFENRSQINDNGSSSIKVVNVSALLAVGITYPINYFTTLFAGPEIAYGLSDVLNSAEYLDAFGNKTATKKATLSKFTIKFGISHKF